MTARQPSAALDPWQKRALYAASALLWITGAVWIFLRYSGELWPATPPAQTLCLKIHGAAAMAFLIIFGTLLPHHVRLGWRQGGQRHSGMPLLGICGILIITGWVLYYAGSDQTRSWASVIHWVLGLALPAIILIHARLASHNWKPVAREKRHNRASPPP